MEAKGLTKAQVGKNIAERPRRNEIYNVNRPVLGTMKGSYTPGPSCSKTDEANPGLTWTLI